MVDTSVAPYNDDYNEDKNFYSILYNPRRAVQVRELNQMQTMLQKQVERFGSHVFENGSLVVPGEINYNLNYDYVTFNSFVYEDFVDILSTNEVTVTGTSTGIVAKVVQHFGANGSDPVTFYLQYVSGSSDVTTKFNVGELLALKTVSSGTTFTLATVSTKGKGSVLTTQAGIFYVNGRFLKTTDQRTILSKYTTTPSVVVGLRAIEEIIDWTEDTTLLDNSAGTSNANAIGADRLKITLEIETHGLADSYNKENFIELVKFSDGILQNKARSVDYSFLEDTLARRTYDESGDYTVTPFSARVLEHLLENNNGGLYTAGNGGDSTKFAVGVEKGKAYVRGYEIENISTRYISAKKARNTDSINNSSFSLPLGNYITVSGINILPVSTSFQTITFYSGTPASAGAIPSGSVLGTARVRYTQLDVPNNRAKIYLFDIKNAAGVVNSSFVSTAGSVYAAGSPAFTATMFSGLSDSLNHKLVYKLPISNVKSLLNIGLSDTSITVMRQYTGTTDSNGTLVLTANANEVFVTPTQLNSCASYTITATSTTREIASISTMGGVPVGSTLTIAFGAPVASKVITVNVEVIKETAIQKTKTPTVTSVTKTAGSMVNRVFTLGKADVYKITSITENGVDKIKSYTLNTGKTLSNYGMSTITLKPNEPLPTNNVVIGFEYFLHGAGDFFTVDSYVGTTYDKIPYEYINNETVCLSDVLDFRSRVNDTDTGYTGTGSSITEVPSGYTIARCDLTYYLPRVDKVVVNSKGQFSVVEGISALNPTEPATPSDSMSLYILNVPAYTKSTKDIKISFIENRRYTMRDIGKLEQRISNIEYYTTLNMLENETNSQQIIDPATGLNRFKNGFLTDNFTDHSVGFFSLDEYHCSVSPEDATLRPEFYADEVDFSYKGGTNVVKTGDLITLPYTEVHYFSQSLASGIVNVNPYAVYLWYGDIKLTPNSDVWFDTVYTLPDVNYNVVNNGKLTQSWNSWGLNWNGGTTESSSGAWWTGRSLARNVTTTTTTVDVVSDRIVRADVIPYMRSRDVAFSGKGLLPLSRCYAMFDDIDVSAYCAQTGKSMGQPMIVNADGEITGIFRIPNNSTLKFRTGTKQFTLIDNPQNDKNASLSYADEFYSASGTLLTRTQSINATQNISSRTVYWDPVAQSFVVSKTNGAFLTSIDVFFESKDTSIPVTLQIREMVNGYPGKAVVPYSTVTKAPSAISLSANGTVATKFTFNSPVYLMEGVEYCFVLMSNSNKYNVFVAEMGKNIIGTNNYISKQPFIGVLFKSQNNSTWTADQTSDLKFVVRCAEFDTGVTGVANFANVAPDIITLANNPLLSTSASNVVTINIPNHGFVAGTKFGLGGILTAPAIPLVELNKVQTVTSVVDLDNVTFTTTSNANITGSFGGDDIIVSRNIMVNNIQPVSSELSFDATTCVWNFSGKTGKSLNGTETPYLARPSFNFEMNSNIQLPVPYIIPSEVDRNDKFGSADSTLMTATMKTTSKNVSPVIDVNRVGMICVANRINNPVSLSETTVSGGNAEARYVTNIVGLKVAANSLKVFADVNKPQGTNIKVYYKIGSTEEETSLSSWAALTEVTTGVSIDQNTFTEFEYAKNTLANFSFYQFKIVLLATNSSVVPKVRRLRGIALGT